MNGRRVALALGIAAAAVTLENVLYFRSIAPPAPPPDAAGAFEAESSESDAPPADASLAAADVAAYLATLPVAEPPRSPFLTRAEAAALAAGDPGAAGAAQRLGGTLVSAARRVAWIDGVPASEGDVSGGRRVARIEPGAVVLAGGEGELRIVVPPPDAFALPADEAAAIELLEGETP